jgi:hypothetical protein
MARPSVHSTAVRAGALGAVVLVAVGVAVALQRNGHTQGDDFALYLRQARSVFDGDMGKVVADNRFTVVNSDRGFSPIAYPWGWPLLLSPFVHLWGLDYGRLKLVEVAVFATWLVLLHGIVRRRAGRVTALALTAVIATAPLFLAHTDQLLTEFPHVAAVAVAIWWYDRVRDKAPLIHSSTSDLVVLGALITVAFNMRREGIVLIAVVGLMQVAELLDRARGSGAGRRRALTREVRESWRTIVLPHASFAGTTVLFQLLLPTMLLPSNGNSRKYIDNRFGDYPEVLAKHLGLGGHPAFGVAIIAIALAGVVVGVSRRPSLDGPLALLAFFSALAISTHFRMVDRYWFQVTPWVLYFAAVAMTAAVDAIVRRRPRLAVAVGTAPLLALVLAHAVVLPGDIGDARAFDSAGRVQIGPAHPDVITVYDAVRDRTPPTAVIAFFRARTMTLLTDRLAIQSSNIDRVRQRADYFAQRRGENYWQPKLTTEQAHDLGFEMVWSDPLWILWKLTPP